METSVSMDQAITDLTIRTGKYLTFTLGAEEYGIGILKVKEIIGMMPITSVPRTPDFLKGIINLRGKVIPVVDLRLKFKMASIPYNDKTCIVVVEVDTNEKTVLMGIVVDTVSEVLNIRENEIEDPPEFGTRLDTSHMLGMAKTKDSVKILLNIDSVLNTSELSRLEKVKLD